MYGRADAGMTQALQANTQSSQRLCLQAAATFRTVHPIVIWMIAFTLTLSGGIGWLLINAIALPLLRAIHVLQAPANKDLTQTFVVEDRDEIGQMAVAVNTSIAGISTMRRNKTYGALQIVTQSSYVNRAPWYVAPGQPKDAHVFMEFINHRYVLP
jgi:methyl-accepting chemotaxis protein